jgi:hypothetical protein
MADGDNDIYDSEDAYSSPLSQGLNSQPQTQAQPASDAPAQNAQPQGSNLASLVQQQQAQSAQAPPPDVQLPDNSSPDMSAVAQPQPMVRFQRTIGNTLRGMIMGLAQNGIPGMVGGAISPTGVQRNADQAEQEAQMHFKFASAQAAAMAADATMKTKQLDNYDEDHQQQVYKENQETADWFMNHGYNPTTVTQNDGNSEFVAAKNLGTVPPVTSLQVAPNQIMHFDLSQMPQQVGLDAVNQLNDQLGKPEISQAMWAGTPQQQRLQMIYNTSQYWTPAASEDTLTQYKNDLARVSAIPDSQLPDKQATIDKYNTLIKNMQTTLDQANQRTVDQKVNETKQVGEAETQVAANKAYATTQATLNASNASVKDANGNWNPASMPVGLVEGTIDPSQLSKRSKDYNATLVAANQYSIQKYGKPFDIAQAQADYKYASNAQTQNTLKMINGMSEPGGSIDIAKNAAQNLPAFNSQTLNKIFNATATEFGSTDATNFHTSMLGLADEYSKVMGGGVSSDTGRQQSLDILKAAYSKGQLAGAISTMQSDINARKTALIGTNRYLVRQYGNPVQSGQQQFQKYSSDGKWGWNGSQWVGTGR